MLKKPPTRHLPVSRFPLLMTRSGLGLKYMFYFKYIKKNKQKQKYIFNFKYKKKNKQKKKYVLNIIYYNKTKILIKNNLKHAQKSAQKLEKIVQKVEDKKKPVL